ncbi:hypothetical protein F5Y11DRAFT_61770 [Daldinia sp. FL1419]|nr:hypothetical protein F5Y11DRAFT_61770 [Daldinia sp. FL1419]
MDNILDTRVPKGGGFRYKGGSGGGGGGGSSPLPWWGWVIIVSCLVWLCAFIFLMVHFFKKDYLGANPSDRDRLGLRLIGRLAWKSFRYVTGIQIFIWAARKIRSRKDRSTKKVGGTFYRKIDEEERGVKDGSEYPAMPPAQLNHEPPAYTPAYAPAYPDAAAAR